MKRRANPPRRPRSQRAEGTPLPQWYSFQNFLSRNSFEQGKSASWFVKTLHRINDSTLNGSTRRSHLCNLAKLSLTERHHRQPRLANQRNSLQLWIALNLAKCNRTPQRLHCCDVERGPVALLCCRVCICGARHLSDSDYGLFVPAVIEKDFIAFLHFAQVISSSEIAHARPAGLPVGYKIRPGIGGRLLLHQPKRMHNLQAPSSQHPEKHQASISNERRSNVPSFRAKSRLQRKPRRVCGGQARLSTRSVTFTWCRGILRLRCSSLRMTIVQSLGLP